MTPSRCCAAIVAQRTFAARVSLVAGAAAIALLAAASHVGATVMPRTITIATGVSPITWKLTSSTAAAAAAPITSVNAAWAAPVTGSKWISTDTKQGTLTKGAIGTLAKPATTSYVASFTLPAGYSAPSLSITLEADNAATVYLNGNLVNAQKQADYHPNYQTSTTFTTSTASFFSAGGKANTLEVRVADYGTATGLDYSATVTYTPALVNVSNVSLTGDGSSPLGIASIGLGSLPMSNLVPQPNSNTSGTSIDPIQVGRIQVGRIQVGRIQVGRIQVGRIQVGRIQVGRIATASITLQRLGTAKVGDTDLIGRLLTSTLAELPLVRPGGWPALLAETTNLKDALPQSTTLADVLRDPTPPRELVDPTCSASSVPACSPVTLDQFILAGTPLAEVPWIGFLLDGMTWNDIGAPTGGWCPELIAAGLTTCGPSDLSATILSSALQGLALDQTSLGVRTFGDLHVTSTARPLFLGLPISGLNIAGTFLGDITPAQLTAAGKDPNVVIDCGGVSPCPYANLRAAAAAGKIRSTALWSDLGSTLNGAPLVDLPLAYADPTSLPWEQMDLASAHIEQMFPGTAAVPGLNFVHETLSFTLPCGEPALASVTLPGSFAYRPGSTMIARNGGAAAALADPTISTTGATWAVPAVACGATPSSDAVVLTFQLLPGLTTGSFSPTASVAVDASGATAGGAATAVSIGSTGTPQASANSLIVGQISTPNEVDRYSFDVPPGKTLTVTLSQLKYDADLVLYQPAGAAAAALLHGTTTRPIPVGVAPVGDSGSATSLQPPVLQDIPLMTGRDVAGISAFRGLDPESITTTTVPGTGGGSTYTVQVSGYNGASGSAPYELIVRVSDPTPLPGCSASPTFAAGVNAPTGDAMPTVGPGVDTLILVDRARLRAAFGATGDTIVNRLENPATFADPALGIHPAVVPLDAVPAVNSALSNWDAQPCATDRSNAAVKAIDDAVDSLGTFANNNLANVRNMIIVADGTVIPHAALPDGTTDTNERDFVGDTIFNGQATQMTGAAGNGMFLSDAPYGAFTPLSVQGQVIYLPQVALGRLGGDGQTILNSIDQYTKSHGLADPNSVSNAPRTAFETDYDFFADGGAQIRNTFTQQLGAANVSSLFVPAGGAAWTVPQFAAALFPPGGPADVIAPNAHFDPSRLLAAAGLATQTASDMYTTSQLDAATPNLDLGASFPQQNSLALRVVFTIGCHAALDVPDTAAGTSPSAADAARMLDWEQVLQRKGTAVMVGNLGYGVGDSASVAFDERLMANYATLLDGSRTAGAGLLEAEQGYFRTLSAFSPYDIKVLEEAVMWGFPSYRLPSAGATAPPPSPVATPMATDPISGLDSTTVDITSAGFHKTTVTDAVTGLQKAYYDNAGQVSDVHPYPIMPQAAVDLPAPSGEVAHGAVPLAWAQTTQAIDSNFASGGYAFSNATIDSAALEPATAARTSYPSGFENIGTTYALDGTARQQLVVVPAQFRSNATGSPAFGSFRTYTDGLWLVTYSANTTDFTGPAFANLETVVDGTGTAISADVTDSAGVARVFAQALRADGTYWRVELQREGSTNRYGGVLGGTDVNPVSEVTYFALDANGNSSSANNKGPGFVSSPAPSGIANGSLTFSPPLPPSASNGWYTSAPTVTVSGTGYSLRVDNGPSSPAGTPVNVGDGAHTVYALDAGNNVVGTAPVFVDTTDPTITGSSAPAANGNGWNNGDVTVTFKCDDAVSMIAACTQPVTVSSEGAGQSVSGTATNYAGRTAQTTVSGINIDKTAPDLTGVPTTSPNAAGWYTGDVTVQWQASDGLSGIDTAPGNSVITGEGVNLSSSQVSATDKAGNQKTATFGPVKIDRTAPQVQAGVINDDGTPRAPNAAGWFNSSVRVHFTCTDNLSGVADCPNDSVLSQNGANQQAASGPVHDVAGNANPGAAVSGINIDNAAPQSTISSPCTTAGSWCQGSFQLTIDASDQTGLSGVKEIHYAIDGGSDQTVAGAHAALQLAFASSGQHVISYYAVDNAGNTEPANQAVFNVDSISPTLTHMISPPPNADGWDRADTTVTFMAQDDPQGSGIDPTTLTRPFTVNFETGFYQVTGNVSDLAGNAATPDVVTVMIDKTPPTVTASALPAPNANGWNNGPVTITYTCGDTLSHVASCPSTTVVSANGANQMISDAAYDHAGNSTPVSTTLNIDAVKPSVSVTGPKDGGVYTLGAVPMTGCAASDDLSGLAPGGCSVNTTGGLANGVGTFTTTASVSDNAGNANSAQVTYRVVYKWGGFISPVAAGGATAIIKAGGNVPVSFQVQRADGTPVQTNTPAAWVAPTKGTALPAGARANIRSTTLSATTGGAYVWDATNHRYRFIWPTSSSQAGFFWLVSVTLDDGTTHMTTVGLSQLSGGSGSSDPDDPGDQGT
jgi:hypothetical protein